MLVFTPIRCLTGTHCQQILNKLFHDLKTFNVPGDLPSEKPYWLCPCT